MRRDVRSGEPCTCGHPALVHRWDDAHACQAEGCICTAYERAMGARKMHNEPVVICVRCEHLDQIHADYNGLRVTNKKGPCRADSCDCVEFMPGRRFASKLEARRAEELMLLERAGEICNLRFQPRYPIIVNGERVCVYVADFSYDRPLMLEGERETVEDTKGYKTDVYKLKKKLMKAVNGIEIREISG